MQIPKLGIIVPKMGRTGYAQTGLAGALFSRVQTRLLGLLFGQPDRTFHSAELIRLAGSGTGGVLRELDKLARAEIVAVTLSGNRKLYQANRQSPIFKELYGIVIKTIGLLEPLRRALRSYWSKIDFAFVYGSIATGRDTAKSDIDLMIIGKDLSYGEIYRALQTAERVLRRPVSPNLMTASEWKRKLADKNLFVTKILQQPKLFIAGTENELKRIG